LDSESKNQMIIDVRRAGVSATGVLPALATVGLLSFVDSNRAADTDAQKDVLKSGAQLWSENCIMRHEITPRISFSSAKLNALLRHIREEADLSPEEQEAVLGFLKDIPQRSAN
jgi:hypothetical protein